MEIMCDCRSNFVICRLCCKPSLKYDEAKSGSLNDMFREAYSEEYLNKYLHCEPVVFEIGDKVCAWGISGIVIKSSNLVFPVEVELENCNGRYCFTTDGRYCDWHKTPALKLIKKATPPKKKIKLYRARVWLHENGNYRSDEFWVDSKEKFTNCLRGKVLEWEETEVEK